MCTYSSYHCIIAGGYETCPNILNFQNLKTVRLQVLKFYAKYWTEIMEIDFHSNISAIPALGRVIERFLVIFGAIISIFLGYKLFISGVVNDQSATGEFRSFRISFAQVGPGVFFGLFGTVIFGYSLASPVTFNLQENGARQIVSFAEGSQDSAVELIKALNALEDLRDHPEFITPNFYPSNNFEKTFKVLHNYRNYYMIRNYGAVVYDDFLDNYDEFVRNPSDFSAGEREVFQEILTVYESRFTQ